MLALVENDIRKRSELTFHCNPNRYDSPLCELEFKNERYTRLHPYKFSFVNA